jgi:hypothetical protein
MRKRMTLLSPLALQELELALALARVMPRRASLRI